MMMTMTGRCEHLHLTSGVLWGSNSGSPRLVLSKSYVVLHYSS